MQNADTKKTLTFVLVAGIALLVAWEPWRPAPPDTSVPERVGQKLFPEFDNPLAAKSLEIVSFNEETAAIRDFRVAQINGVWSIPSHNNYPADAQDHMAKAATALMDLTILAVVSNNPGDQQTYGVITPDPAKLKVGETGVGMRVTARTAGDKPLADLVIGKQDKDMPGVHFVREASRDLIYKVKIQTSDFSTKFGDWIEKDLLKLTAFDIREVDLNDYSSRAVIGPDGRGVLQLDQRSQIELGFDDAKSDWTLVSMKEFDDKGQPHDVKLAEDEKLNTTTLNNLKTALDDLQIIDVQRKPQGLSQDLRASEEFLNNAEAVQSLHDRGFVAVPRGPGMPPEIFSSEGEVTTATKDGVRYVLRFGDVAGVTATEDEPSADKKDESSQEQPKSGGPSRYLFVMAQFDESLIPKPMFEAVPGEDATEEKKEGADGEAPEAKSPETPPADKPAEAAPADKPADKAPETKTAAQEPAAAKAEPAAATDAAKTEAPPAAETPAADKPAEAKPEEQKPATPEEQEKLRVRQENKRRQDEYDAAVNRGQDKVKELNDRFADWYFIISDDVYKKIHLGRKDIIEKKTAEKDAATGELKGLEDGINIGPALKKLAE